MLRSTQLWRKGCCGSRGSGSSEFLSTLGVTRLRSTGRTRSSSLPGSRLATASPTACGGNRLARTRRSVSLILAGDDSNGRAIRRVLQRRMPPNGLGDAPPDEPKAKGKCKKARREEGVLHLVEPWRRQPPRLGSYMAVLCVSFGSSVALCQAASRAAGRGRCCCHNVRDPYPVHLFAWHSARR